MKIIKPGAERVADEYPVAGVWYVGVDSRGQWSAPMLYAGWQRFVDEEGRTTDATLYDYLVEQAGEPR